MPRRSPPRHRLPYEWPSPAGDVAREFRVEDVLSAFVHESRNAVFGISATLAAFEADFGASALGAEFARMMGEPLERLTRLTSELAEYARPSSLEPKLVEPRQVAITAIEQCAPVARLRDVEVRLCGGDVRDAVLDPDQIVWALAALIDCGIARSAPGGVVDLQVDERTSGAERTLRFAVGDRGPPLEPGAFEPAFRPQGRGSVFNLARVQRIALQHRGAVVAENCAGGLVLSLMVREVGSVTPEAG